MEENLTVKERTKSEEAPLTPEGPICAVCGGLIEERDYSGQNLDPTHAFNLIVSATAGDAFLPHALQVHGECLKDLKDMLMEINKGYRWV